MNKISKISIIVVALVAVWGAGIFFYLEVEKQKSRAAFEQEMHLQMLGIDTNPTKKKSVRIFMTSGDCNSEANMEGEFWNGHTAVAYCANPEGSWHPRLESSCLGEGIRKWNDALGDYDITPSHADYVALACGIAESYPEHTEDWQDSDLGDSLESLINDYVKNQ